MFKAIRQYFGKLTTVNEILEVILLRPEEAGSKYYTQIVSAHLITLLLLHHEIRQENQQQYEYLMIHILHILQERANEGYFRSLTKGNDPIINLIVEERVAQVVHDLLEAASVKSGLPQTTRISSSLSIASSFFDNICPSNFYSSSLLHDFRKMP